MDVRMRAMLLESPRTSFIHELLVCLLVIGAMTLAAARAAPRILQHLHVLEAVYLSSAPITDLMEFRAVTGAWPSSTFVLPKSPTGSDAIRDGGAIDFTLSARAGNAAGKIVTFRAWQNSGAADLPMAWLCGHARATPLIATGIDKTMLTDEELPSPCRERK
jgi:hypothetical protein